MLIITDSQFGRILKQVSERKVWKNSHKISSKTMGMLLLILCFIGIGGLTLAVIMHHSSGEDTVEMFKFDEKKQILIHSKTVRDPLFYE